MHVVGDASALPFGDHTIDAIATEPPSIEAPRARSPRRFPNGARASPRRLAALLIASEQE